MMYFILTKKSCVLSLIILCCVGMAAGCITAATSHADMRERHRLSVIIDAGHGQPDGGAVGAGGTIEQEINLAIAKKLEEVLSAKGVKVIMTRSDENGLWTSKSKTIREMKLEDMKMRMSIMKSSHADLFITIHMNSYKNSSASGLRIFYSKNHPDIKPLAENIQNRMSDVTGAQMHVVQTADTKLFLLKNPPLPSILVECGFLSNPPEEKKLCDDDYQARLAWALADAVEKYFSMP
ncbi:MAG: N-acetylmuramoyl-L-alanine amidase [Clostridiales bacterium]|nr:N-acetylmuramoyl-L-alanine amidase [Clostridiales bacterium]